ncbi:hypothetical protein DICPUDRAFT_96609 [Dictyostelium purpureum]|uniref:non-specific serine/threonine protein kinase n=1 Tax=Dictyostelium purpureum TaxID=5786 RepID=F0Z9X7_DICPU|nr:uncharacterized protein DICPUDRAFT_96609 [Dictyostelium purpureum]EGC39194.1 hypothetical protein DICPUDRAFT_96609 [Dictyostelium purpureum]|eukprot:XP_003284221.1 hypothetical protein DICPUDRAFT_96609 [Dictyostelium purpureum]
MSKNKETEEIKKNVNVGNYNLGVVIGKGGFGTVYQGLDIEDGDFVAIKQINLTKIPKDQLQGIMNEIDLLKNLNHANIVKYIKYVKTKENLYIVLEYVENGSLSSLIKKFGKFPESLVCVYIRQVLEGLVYLHEQGVVHRDIKGANILTTKEGKIKLADFGVATKFDDSSAAAVVGTPYWMAPEIIELNGATTKSDIWSVGCTVIELLTGSPPYYDLGQMPALFRIVQDDCPPLPEGISPPLKDWLMQCFQKDPNLRISAQKLLKHKWIQASIKKKQQNEDTSPANIDDIAKNIQDYNERINKKPSHQRKPSIHPKSPKGKVFLPPPEEDEDEWGDDFSNTPKSIKLPDKKSPLKTKAPAQQSPLKLPNNNNNNNNKPAAGGLKLTPKIVAPEVDDDDWGDDFGTNTVSDLSKAVSSLKIKGDGAGGEDDKGFIEDDEDDDDGFGDDFDSVPTSIKLNPKFGSNIKSTSSGAAASASGNNSASNSGKFGSSKSNSKTPLSPRGTGTTGSNSSSNAATINKGMIDQWGEDKDDEGWGDVATVHFDPKLIRKGSVNKPDLSTRLKNRLAVSSESSSINDEEDDDPFADDFEEEEDDFDLDKNLMKDNYARMSADIIKLMNLLTPEQPEDVISGACEQLISMFKENSEQKTLLIRRHGVIPIMEMLEVSNIQSHVLCSILKVVNQIIDNNMEIQENLCLVGGIPAIMKFSGPEYPPSVRLETAAFISKMCSTSTLTLQMFIACKGLPILVDFLLSPYYESKKLVWMAIDAIVNVFELQSPTPKNDFCRLFSKCGLLKTLPIVLRDTIADGEASQYPDKIINLFILFSSADSVVRRSMSAVEVIRPILDSLSQLMPEQLVKVLKSIKQISMDHNTLANLQNAGAIRVMVPFLGRRTGTHCAEIHNHVLNTMFHLCRIDAERQYQAALDGIIPHLQYFITTHSPLNQFALPIICDLAHSKKARAELWKHNGVEFYLSLLEERYWQVNALDSLAVWIADDTHKVENIVSKPENIKKLVHLFTNAESQSFAGILEPLLRIIQIAIPVNMLLGTSNFVSKIIDKLTHTNPQVRLNLLKIITSLYEAHPNAKKMIQDFKLIPVIQRIADTDKSVLVQKMASKLLEAFNANNVI